VAALLHFVEYRGHTVASSPLPEHLPDLSDEPFLEVALACGAECLVTGNLAHFPTRLRQGVAAFSPGEFMDAYRIL
ncbi:MAG: PIN domain-containing protein, partial [Actinobacteria bacterium]|nr:PIN domain-containing protein [Actinomycetota bacterium]